MPLSRSIRHAGLAIESDGTSEGVHIQRVSAEGYHITDRAVASDDLPFRRGDTDGGITILTQRELLSDNVILRGIAGNPPTGNLEFRRTASDFVMREAFSAEEEILLVLLIAGEGHALDAFAEISITPYRRSGGISRYADFEFVGPYGFESHIRSSFRFILRPSVPVRNPARVLVLVLVSVLVQVQA